MKYGWQDTKWGKDGNLTVRGRISPVKVVEDEKHCGMYRVGSPYSDLTDMVNLTRARDAATAMFLYRLNND